MCGILFLQTSILNQTSANDTQQSSNDTLKQPSVDVQKLIGFNANRGPDSTHQYTHEQFTLIAYVLSLRNPHTPQPIVTSSHVLAFNGQDYNTQQSDSLKLSVDLEDKSEDGLIDVLARIDGEFAALIIDLRSSAVYYCRDRLGRRSLLIKGSTIASVGDGGLGWQEVPTDGVYKIQSGVTTCLRWAEKFKFALNKTITCSLKEQTKDDFYANSKAERATLSNLLLKSVAKRVSSIPASPIRIGVLFSGGLDCMILCALVHKSIPLTEPVELLNVAFDNPRSKQAFDVPDRKTGQSGYQELLRVCPRNWKFIEINVPFDECMSMKDRVIDLITPSDTVMDLSISIAFWFAARGIGLIDGIKYKAEAKVLFSGIGADELFAGYSRHRVSYQRHGIQGLIEQLDLDLSRIACRNLGRDDRVIGDHSREVRLPFLDFDVLRYICSLSIASKCDLRLEKGVGDKALLRGIAFDFGLSQACIEVKRAIQFGARTAKMEFRNQKGNEKIL